MHLTMNLPFLRSKYSETKLRSEVFKFLLYNFCRVIHTRTGTICHGPHIQNGYISRMCEQNISHFIFLISEIQQLNHSENKNLIRIKNQM